MAGSRVEKNSSARKLLWHKPVLDELGNLRDFVRTGNAFGKSGVESDGESMPGGEVMVDRF